MANRNTASERLMEILSGDVIVLMTDEEHFHSSDNKHNFGCWAEEIPQQLHQRPLRSARVTGVDW
jgi:hypothetical protein